MNRGKDFEAQLRKQLETVFDITRIADNTAGYMGGRNICDFLIYKYPNLIYLELKTTKGGTLPFSNITENQFLGLQEKEKVEGVGAGLVVWFVEKDKTFFVSADFMRRHKQNGYKSISLKDLELQETKFRDDSYSSRGTNSFQCFEIKGSKKRVFFDYDIEQFSNDLEVYINYGKRE